MQKRKPAKRERRIITHANARKELTNLGIYPVVISQPMIASSDFRIPLAALRKLNKPKNIWSNRQSLVLSFSGYEDDRPLWQYPEICAYFQRLHAQWPYWLWYARTEDYQPGMIVTLLLGPNLPLEQNAEGIWQMSVDSDFSERLSHLLTELLQSSVQLLERTGRAEEISKKWCAVQLDRWLRAMGFAEANVYGTG